MKEDDENPYHWHETWEENEIKKRLDNASYSAFEQGRRYEKDNPSPETVKKIIGKYRNWLLREEAKDARR